MASFVTGSKKNSRAGGSWPSIVLNTTPFVDDESVTSSMIPNNSMGYAECDTSFANTDITYMPNNGTNYAETVLADDEGSGRCVKRQFHIQLL